jgi:hypothetical protein
MDVCLLLVFIVLDRVLCVLPYGHVCVCVCVFVDGFASLNVIISEKHFFVPKMSREKCPLNN